jgi:hypothetical protein
MASVNPKCYHTSASSIRSFKDCPTRFRLAYREGLRAAKDTDSQRMGTNWHACHEIFANALNEAWANEFTTSEDMKSEAVKAYATTQVMTHLDLQYEKCPDWIEPKAWALEKVILITCFIGYQWYWQNDPIAFLHSELAFNLPIHMPRTGLPISMEEAQRVGKIDHVIQWQTSIGSMERKSTSRAIDPQSDYWDKAKKDTQVSMYALAFRDLWVSGNMPQDVMDAVAATPGCKYGNTLYDVWHKPTIKPAMLTQKETAEFIETGTYMGETFTLTPYKENVDDDHPDIQHVDVDGEEAEVEQGKKGFAIRETVRMYSARLLVDIQERPEFYFARREIARTDADIKKFRGDVYAIYQAMKAFAKYDLWYENEAACRATFPCTYIPICYGPGADAVCDGSTTPPGFKRIFVDLTVNGQEVEE